MGKYSEEVYRRAEKQFKNVEEMIGWLSSFKEKQGNAYEQDAVLVAEDLQRGKEISREAEESNSLIQLNNLSSEANNLKFNQDEPLGLINDRIRIIEGEIIEEKIRFKEGESAQERKEAERRLKELQAGKVVGGMKSGERRRVPSAIRYVL